MKRLIYLFSLLLAMSSASWAQDRVVTGTVTGEDNNPIPGASVLVKGTTSTGSITNLDGKFTINVPKDATALVVSFIGMEKKEVALTSSNVVDVKLSKSSKKIDEVVVTALGIERSKKALGYAQQQIGGEELRSSGEQNLIEGLSAKVAGVQITSTAGTPGASSKIVIRGASTINSSDNQPLIVLDGVPVDNSTDNTAGGDYAYDKNLSGANQSNRALDINPDDIESINVLKGPAAAALYGSNAGNGAIIITTKRGNAKGDKKIHVTVGASVEISQVSKLPGIQHQYAQGSGGGQFDSTGVNVIGGGTFSDATNKSWGPEISKTPGLQAYDHYKEFFETGVGVNTTASVSGGTDKSSIRLSFSNLIQNGVVPNTDFKRTSVRVAADTKITDRWDVGVTADYVHSGGTKAQNGSNLSGVMLGLTRTPASYDLIGHSADSIPHGLYLNPDGTQRQFYGAYDNPFWSVYNNTFTDDVNRFIGNVITKYKFTDWLDASYRLGTDVYSDHREQRFAIGAQGGLNDLGYNGAVELNTKQNYELYGDLLINLHHKLAKDFNGSLTLGNNFDRHDFQDIYDRSGNLTIPNFYNLANGAVLYTSESHSLVKSTALFFDANFDFKNMLYLEVTGRNEWSSTFGSGKSFFYPSANLSWVFTELMKPNKWFSFGKVKASVAQVGIAPPVYSSKTYFAVPNVSDGNSAGLSFPYLGQSGYGYTYNQVLGNPNLRPEKKIGYEGGVDLRFFQGRLTLDFTAYYEKTSDIILSRPVASSSGFNAVVDNSGVMRNQGVELVVGADIVKLENNKFTWNTTLNFSRNRNEVLSLAEGVTEIAISNGFSDIGGYAIAGQPYGVFYGSSWARTSDGKLILDTSATGKGLPMVNGLRGKIGDPNPKFLAGLRNTFSFKGVSISVLFDFRSGGDIWCGTCARLNRLGTSEASADRATAKHITGVVQTGVDVNGNPVYKDYTSTVSAYDYYYSYVGDGGNYATENAIFDGSWVRLREVTISYHYNFKANKLKIQGFDISLTGRNLWLKTKYPGVDPETSLTGASSNLGGFDYFNNPSTKSYVLGFKAYF